MMKSNCYQLIEERICRSIKIVVICRPWWLQSTLSNVDRAKQHEPSPSQKHTTHSHPRDLQHLSTPSSHFALNRPWASDRAHQQSTVCVSGQQYSTWTCWPRSRLICFIKMYNRSLRRLDNIQVPPPHPPTMAPRRQLTVHLMRLYLIALCNGVIGLATCSSAGGSFGLTLMTHFIKPPFLRAL